MKIYMYDAVTEVFIGLLTTSWTKNQIDTGTLLIYNRIKYVVVNSENVEPDVFSVTVNRI